MAIEVFTAAKLLEFAFSAIVTMAVEGSAAQLWQIIRQRLQSNPNAEAAIVKVEQYHSKEALVQLIPLLETEMRQHPSFNQELQQLACQINTSNINSSNSTTVSGGIGQVEARDNSVVVNEASSGGNQILGGTHHTTNIFPEKKP